MLAQQGAIASSGGVKVPDLAVLLMHFDDNLINQVNGISLTSINPVTYVDGVFNKGIDTRSLYADTTIDFGTFEMNTPWTLEFLIKTISPNSDEKDYLSIILQDPNRNTTGRYGKITIIIRTYQSAMGIRIITESDNGNSGNTYDSGFYPLAFSSFNTKIKIVRQSNGILKVIAIKQDGTVLLDLNTTTVTSPYWTTFSGRTMKIIPQGWLSSGAVNKIILDELLFRIGIGDTSTTYPTAPY